MTSEQNRENLGFAESITLHLKDIDSVRRVDPDLLEAENMKLISALANFKEEILSHRDTLDYNWLYIVKSADNKFCLVSWDTRMGGTMIEYATMAIYKGGSGGVFSKMLIDTSNAIQNTLMHYDTLYVVDNGGRPFYIAHGFGQGSTALPWQEVRAFQIENNTLTNPNIFPEEKPNVFVEFDTNKFREDDKVPVIRVANKGETILIPVETENGSFSGHYDTLILKGNVYTKK